MDKDKPIKEWRQHMEESKHTYFLVDKLITSYPLLMFLMSSMGYTLHESYWRNRRSTKGNHLFA